MPITKMSWFEDWNRDRHVLRGQTSPNLAAVALRFEHAGGEDFAADYIAAHPAEVALFFTPLFKGVQNGNSFDAPDSGLHFDITTGALRVDAGAPLRPKFNFVVEVLVTNTANGRTFTEVIRFHVHGGVTGLWLTPSTLTIRPLEEILRKDPPFRFTVRAEFDDRSVGDLTLNHGVTWTPPFNFRSATDGLITLMPTDLPGNHIDITATLPTPAGPRIANGTVHVGKPWSAEPGLPKVSIVPGGGWPGTRRPEIAPNVLFFGDGFPEAAHNSFENVTNSFVQFMKSDRVVRPFDLLATSINFWRTFLPSPFGISVRSEVWTRVEDGKTLAKAVPIPIPAVGDEEWELENMIYAVGLPVAADAVKPDDDLKKEWAALLDPDPAPKLTDSLIKRWKKRATRTFIDEVDAFPGMSYGVVPAINDDFGYLLDLHSDRGGVAALKPLYPLLHSDSGVALDGPRRVGNVWATTDPAWHFDNTDLVVLVSSIPGGRAVNGKGYIAISTRSGNIDLPVTAVGGRLRLDPLPIPAMASPDSCRTMTHELGHSFGLGDEYEDMRRSQPNQDNAYASSANLTTERHAKDANGNFSGDEIRWNWHRIRKAGQIEGAITEPSRGVFKIPLRLGQGFHFTVGDRLLLRRRERLKALPKHPTVLAIDKQLEIGIKPEADFILAVAATPGATTLADLTVFAPGSIVYVPTPAPASAAATTPFAEMIALNVKNEITLHNRPLTPVPCENLIKGVQTPDLTNIEIRGCFSHKTRIVGLYEGGNRFACGVYHPTGECMMRKSHVENAQFCAVCRYILVDFVNPFLHSQIDRDYAKIYPQPD